jgi:ATP-dependent Clp protease adapter protein ClpS
MTQTRTIPEVEKRQQEAPPIDLGGPYVVILYNDDYHTFDEVTAQLQKATGCTIDRAWEIAIEAHTRGRAIAFVGDQQECDRVAGILRAIRLQVETDLF